MNTISPNPVFARVMGPVAREVLGKPTGETRHELRFGTYGSKSIDLKSGTWFDHEAKRGGGLLDFLAHTKALEKSDAISWLEERGYIDAKREPAAPAQRRQVATYDYFDLDGSLRFQVLRYEPKHFLQRKPDGAGGWDWSTKDLELVIYRLPDVIEAVQRGETVYVVEGEKAADRLVALGFCATCSPGGAGKWRDEYTPSLAGADVVVLPDNDDRGRDHVAMVTRALQGTAQRVRLLELPNLPFKGDAWDWIEAGGTRRGFAELVRQGRDYDGQQPLEALADPTIDDLAELVNPATLQGIDPPEREWVVEGWLPVGTVTSLYGGAGFGKTLLAQQLQTATAIGTPFLGLQTAQCKSLAFYCEDDPDELHRRQRGICWHYGAQMQDLDAMRWQARAGKPNVMVTVKDGILRFSEFASFVSKAVAATGAKLVILDNIAQLFGGNENVRSDVTQFVNALSAIALQHGAAVLLLGHPGKATDSQFSGSTAWDAAVRSRWLLERVKPEGEDSAAELADLRVLRKAKANYAGTGDEIPLRWMQGAFQVEGAASVQQVIDLAEKISTRNTDDDAFLACLDDLTEQGRHVSASSKAQNYAPKAMRGKSAATGISSKRLEAAMERLFSAGAIVVGPFGRDKFRREVCGLVRKPAEAGAAMSAARLQQRPNHAAATMQQGAARFRPSAARIPVTH